MLYSGSLLIMYFIHSSVCVCVHPKLLIYPIYFWFLLYKLWYLVLVVQTLSDVHRPPELALSSCGSHQVCRAVTEPTSQDVSLAPGGPGVPSPSLPQFWSHSMAGGETRLTYKALSDHEMKS